VKQARMVQLAYLVWLPALVLLVWYLVAEKELVSRLFVPKPMDVWEVLVDGFTAGDFISSMAITLGRMLVGWLLAAVVALVLAIAITSDARMAALVSPVLEFIRPLPASALIPLAVLMLGLSSQMIVAVIVFGSIWPLLLNAIAGLQSTDGRLKELSRSLQFGRLQTLWKFSLPGALASIVAGLKLGLTLALILCIVAEMISLNGGIGAQILLASRNFRSADLFAGIILVGAIGYVFNLLIELGERRLLRWRGAAR